MPGLDAFTKLLLHCDGADGSTSFTDLSFAPHTVTVNGDAQIDTAQWKFGSSSGLFDGTGDFLTLDGHADFAFGTGDFTIDCWVRLAAVGINQYILDGRPSAMNGLYPSLVVNAANNVVYFTDSGAFALASTTVLVIDTWYHIALARSGATLKLFLNGIEEDSDTDTQAMLIGASRPMIGTDESGQALNGWLDELRVSKGVARWVANFAPPTEPYSLDVPVPLMGQVWM